MKSLVEHAERSSDSERIVEKGNFMERVLQRHIQAMIRFFPVFTNKDLFYYLGMR